MNFQEIKQDSVLPEIQYYISFCLLKRLLNRGELHWRPAKKRMLPSLKSMEY